MIIFLPETIHPFRSSGGTFHVPFNASSLGQYKRNTQKNGPLGAGNQLDSLSLPGD
jgi:hypothetical protein